MASSGLVLQGNNVVPIVYRGVSVSVAYIADHERVILSDIDGACVILHALMILIVYDKFIADLRLKRQENRTSVR